MNIALSKEENVVKSWDYGVFKQKGVGGSTTQTNLTLTNKRLIHSMEGKNKLVKDDILLSEVKGVSGYYEKKYNPLFLIVILIGLALVIAGLMRGIIYAWIAGIVVIIIGILMMRLITQKAFSITIHTSCSNSSPFSFFANTIKRRNKRSIKIKVNYECAKEIVTTLQTAILDYKE